MNKRYEVRLIDGTTEVVMADWYMGEQGYFKFFRNGQLLVFSVAVTDVKRVLEQSPNCSICRHLDDTGSCMRLSSYDQGCGSDTRITPPDGFWCSEYIPPDLTNNGH